MRPIQALLLLQTAAPAAIRDIVTRLRHGFVIAAIRAVRQWKLKPVDATLTVDVVFQ